MKPPKRKRRPRPADEAAYICPSCGEQIVIPIDPTAGNDQQYTEDCPVCCNPNIIHLELFGHRGATAHLGRGGVIGRAMRCLCFGGILPPH